MTERLQERGYVSKEAVAGETMQARRRPMRFGKKAPCVAWAKEKERFMDGLSPDEKAMREFW